MMVEHKYGQYKIDNEGNIFKELNLTILNIVKVL